MSLQRKRFWHDESEAQTQTASAPKRRVAPAQRERQRVVVNRLEDLEPLYTVNHVAKHFGVNPFTIYHWRTSLGLIEGKKLGRDVRFTAQQIKECEMRREALAKGEITYDDIKNKRDLIYG